MSYFSASLPQLPSAIVEGILPIFKDLSEPTLLTRCLDSHTQNPNESLNNMIWKRCPKKICQGKTIVELCTASAVASFNDGARSIAAVLRKLTIAVGFYTEIGLWLADRKRIGSAEKESTAKSKLQRKQVRAIKIGLWDKRNEKEGIVYQSGGFNSLTNFSLELAFLKSLEYRHLATFVTRNFSNHLAQGSQTCGPRAICGP